MWNLKVAGNFFKTVYTYIEQRQYLLDTLSVTACTEDEEGKKNLEYNLKLAGKKLCKVAFLRVLEISEKRMRNITRLYVEGATISQPRLYLQRRTFNCCHSDGMLLQSYWRQNASSSTDPLAKFPVQEDGL